jgi:hypothetical protein
LESSSMQADSISADVKHVRQQASGRGRGRDSGGSVWPARRGGAPRAGLFDKGVRSGGEGGHRGSSAKGGAAHGGGGSRGRGRPLYESAGLYCSVNG